MIILSNTDLTNLLPPPAVIAAVESAARAQQKGEATAPKRLHLEWAHNSALVMPAVSQTMWGTKLVSIVPTNAARGLPVTSGLMVLHDGDSGVPRALLNAAALTAHRTGAIGAMAIKLMTPPDIDTLGLIGTGVQGTWQTIYAATVRPIQSVLALSRARASFDRFSTVVTRHAPQLKIIACHTAEELLRHTSLVIAATTSSTPVVPDDPALVAGKHFISIGSFKPAMQELPDAVFRLAGELAIDSDAAREEVGDVIGPLQRNILKPSDVYFIGELLTGRRSINTAHTTAFKSVGMALYDLFTAKAFYDAAKRKGIGHEIDL